MLVTVLLWVAAVACILVGFVGIVAPALPGPALVYLGLVLMAWAHGFERIGLAFLLVTGLLTALVLLVDFAAGAVGTQRYGGTRWGILGAAVGAVVGLFVFPPFGVVIGPLAGAILGELVAGRSTEAAARAGWGSFLGFLGGTLVKYVACTGMVLAAIVAHVW